MATTKKTKKRPIMKFPTDCCALAQLSIGNAHTIEEIKKALDTLRQQSKMMNFLGTGKEYGQKAVFVISMPTEHELVKNLTALGFKSVFQFERRKGYPEGQLTMWCINL